MQEKLNNYTNNKNEGNNSPVKKFRAGTLSLSVWKNKVKDNKEISSISFQRSYKNYKDEWEHTQTLRVSDLPKLKTLLDEAYKSEILTEVQ